MPRTQTIKSVLKGTGYIEALCPIDHDTCSDTNGTVPDISNQEFNAILTLIS